jgi:penicillin-binding protein 2
MRSAEPEALLARRTRLLYWGVALVLALYVGRLWYLQVVFGEKYRQVSQTNSVKTRSLDAPRGLIRDRHGRVLVGNRLAHDLVLDREMRPDLDAVATWVAAVTGGDPEDLRRSLRGREREPAHQPVGLASDLSFSQVAWIEARAEDQPALSIRTQVLRQYPHREVAAHVLGYVGQVDREELERPEVKAIHRAGDLVGKTGVEARFDRLLTGRRGARRVVVDNLGREILSTVEEEPLGGSDVHLTIDLDLQRAAETALAGQRGACVFLDPRDGSVLVLASAPAFEPEAFAGGISKLRWRQYRDDPQAPLRFRAIGEVYPPGSVWKPLMTAAALATGARRPEDTFTCLGQANVYGLRRCWKKGGHGVVDMRQALVHSCNVYYYLCGKDLGLRPIESLAGEIGFGQVTGIDLPGEKGGVLPGDAWKRRTFKEPWYPGDTINVAIGQGFLAVTPLQVAQMAAAIATGGDVHRPHVFSHATDPGTGQVTERAQSQLERHAGLTPEATRFLRDAMTATVDVGTGRRARVTGLQVAGKTGTAQPASGDPPEDVPADELPDRYRTHAWFMGFAPSDDPRLAFAVVVEHAGEHGGTVAAPVAQAVLEAWSGQAVAMAGQ